MHKILLDCLTVCFFYFFLFLTYWKNSFCVFFWIVKRERKKTRWLRFLYFRHFFPEIPIEFWLNYASSGCSTQQQKANNARSAIFDNLFQEIETTKQFSSFIISPRERIVWQKPRPICPEHCRCMQVCVSVIVCVSVELITNRSPLHTFLLLHLTSSLPPSNTRLLHSLYSWC